jgi:thiamine-phosphate pyrophosphorylase
VASLGPVASLERARLYFITEPVDGAVLEAALAGGVDAVQLRVKNAPDEEIVRAAAAFRRLCDRFDAAFILNDRADLVEACAADGVHVGQDDVPIAEARRLVGPARIVGVSTHTREQIEAALQQDVDYLAVGPVYATPTKPGRPGVGVELVRIAAELRPRVPWFAIGGIDRRNAVDVVSAGARRVAVVRAIRDADDPRAAASALSAVLAV